MHQKITELRMPLIARRTVSLALELEWHRPSSVTSREEV